MKTTNWLRLLMISAFSFTIIGLAIFWGNALLAQAQQRDADEAMEQNAKGNNAGGAALSSGLIGLAPGQSLRLSAVNVGGKDIKGELVFIPVNEKGEAGGAIPCNAIVSSANAASATFKHSGGVNRVELYAQIRVYENVRDLSKLVPSLEVIDDQSGRTVFALSGSDFVSLRPIYIPPHPVDLF